MASDEASGWTELRLLLPAPERVAALDAVEALCLQLSPGGYLVEDAGAPPGDRPSPPLGMLRYTVYVPEGEREAARALLDAAAAGMQGARVEDEPLDLGWRERWKQWFHGFEVSPRLAVRPPWEADAGPAGRHVVVIEPGLAFGTGQHETTRLCLLAIDELAVAGQLPPRVLDVGCGTGILSIAACLLGAGRVTAIDVDPGAVTCASENAERNGVAGALVLGTTPVGDLDGSWPLVVANILASVLVGLATPLCARVEPGGRLLLCGVLAEQADGVRQRFEAEGLRAVGSARDGEWVRLDLERPA